MSSAHFQPRRPCIIQWGEGEGAIGTEYSRESQCGTVSPRCFCRLSVWKKVRKTYRAGEPIRTVIFRKSIENIWILRISIQRLNFVKLCNDKGIKYCPMESKNVVDSGFIVSGTCILESLSSILVFPYSKAKDSRLHKQFFDGFRNSSTGLPYLGQ